MTTAPKLPEGLEPVAYLVTGLRSGEPSLCFEDERGDYGDEDHTPVFDVLICLSDAQAALQALAAEKDSEIAALKLQLNAAAGEPKEMAFWFMRDNHTFRKLSGTSAEMVAQCLEEFDAGWNYGSLFAKNVPSQRLGTGVHACGPERREDFRINALAAIDSALALAAKEAK